MGDPKFYKVNTQTGYAREITGTEYVAGTAGPGIWLTILLILLVPLGVCWLAWKISKAWFRGLKNHPVVMVPITLVVDSFILVVVLFFVPSSPVRTAAHDYVAQGTAQHITSDPAGLNAAATGYLNDKYRSVGGTPLATLESVSLAREANGSVSGCVTFDSADAVGDSPTKQSEKVSITHAFGRWWVTQWVDPGHTGYTPPTTPC